MQLEIAKGKEIQFVQSIDLYLRTINNDQRLQKLLDCFNLSDEDFDFAYKIVEELDLSVITAVFERINNRKSTIKNNSGEKYLAFSTDNLDSFILSPQGTQLLGFYVLWNAIGLKKDTNKIKSEIQITYLFYMLLGAVETFKHDLLNYYFNTQEFKDGVIKTFPFSILSFSTDNHAYYIEDQNKLIPVDFLSNANTKPLQLPIYTVIDKIIYKITGDDYDFGYNIFFNKAETNIEGINTEKLVFTTGLFIPYDHEYIHDLRLFYLKPDSSIVDDIQSQYNKLSNLLTLMPKSYEISTRKKAINTFISLIYSLVEKTLNIYKASPHIIQTITGLIAYDFKILELDVELNPNDKSKEDSEILRKRVSNSIGSANKLKLNY